MKKSATIWSMFIASVACVFGASSVFAAAGASWSATPMSQSGDTIRTDGTLAYARAQANSTVSYTVNGVEFVGIQDTTSSGSNISFKNVSTSSYGYWTTSEAPSGATGDYATLLGRGWWIQSGDCTLKVKSLTVGKKYLVQMIVCSTDKSHSAAPGYTTAYAPGSSTIFVKANGDGWEYGGSLIGTFTAENTEEAFTINYSGANAYLNAVQVRELGGDTPTIVSPEIGSVSANVSGTTATISLANVKMGTDDEGTNATCYSVSYSLNGAAAVKALDDQTAASAAFDITGLADGSYTCAVTITTDKSKTSAAKSVNFKINTVGPTPGWEVGPMDIAGQTISTLGDKVGAYSILDGTVHDVAFVRSIPVTKPDDGKVVASPAAAGSRFGDFGWVASGDYGTMLSHGSYWAAPANVVLTFSGLTVGNVYQIQLVSHNDSASGVTISVEGTEPQHICKVDADETYKYGASITGTFTATAATQDVSLSFAGSGEGVLNAIQIRDISSVKPKIVNPGIGSVAAVPDITTAQVTLSGITLGTDSEGVAATSYDVFYKLGEGGEIVTAKEDQTAAAVDFTISDLASQVYDCYVWIVNDALKSSTTNLVEIDMRPVPTAPSIGSVKAVASGTTATITLSGIVKGTNAEGTEKATSYTLSYSLGGGTTEVASGLTDATATFDITDLVPGTYTCTVTITTDKSRSANGSVSFKIREPGPGEEDALKISEICPRPTAYDPNGKESGWIELWNSGSEDVDLADYEIVRVNRGKALKASGKKLASRIVHPGDYTLVYMSEEYDNVDSGVVQIYDNDVMVCPKKISPKKFPLVALYKGSTLLEQFVVPVDLPDNQSFAPAGGAFGEYAGEMGGNTTPTNKLYITAASAVTRVILPNITPGAENNRTDESAYGPNVGPLYGLKHDYSDWHAFPLAKVGVPYEVSMAINPLTDADGDEIESVTLVYRLDHARADIYETEKYGTVVMTKGEFVAGEGQLWTATIPYQEKSDPKAEDQLRFKAGRLLRWSAQITDKSGNTWRSPSFRNPEDGYEWYGTLIEPTADQLSETLPTWHIFVCRQGKDDMDWQYSTITNWYPKRWPYGVRCGIFDSQTSNYYDNVRIDVRGNTTAEYPQMAKKSHGLKFSKVHPLQCTNPFDGEKIECRKTSLLAEYQDPSNLRSDLSMYLRRQAGQEVTFGYPVRLQCNGEFYQLAHHSNRFTDEYMTDYLGYDEKACVFKNVGTVGGDKDTGGGASQVLPDDGTDVMPEFAAFKKGLIGSNQQTVAHIGRLVDESTNTVVKLYDLPYWFNFLAISRITQECDDDTSTLNLCYDRYGNGAWRPMAYDVHQSFGVFWADTDPKFRPGLIATNDANCKVNKCHPYHGGLHAPQNLSMGNRAYEGIYQTPKFRRLLVRRLRTLMDEILKEPGTAKEDTPFWRDYVEPMHTAMKADNDIDRTKKPINVTAPLYVWPGSTPLTFEEAVDDMWENYIVPRRKHLYVTHSITNTAYEVGYAGDKNAGIPLAQSPIAALKAKFSAAVVDGGAVIRNLNGETVDMSGWKLSGAIDYEFPAGSVIDQAFGDQPGEVFIVTDRKTYIANLEDAGTALTDQVILGNAKSGAGVNFTLKDAKGETVIGADEPTGDGYEFVFKGDYTTVQTVAPTGTTCKIVLTNANLNAGLIIPAGITAKINASTNTVNFLASLDAGFSEVRFTGEGTVKLEGADTLATVSNLVVKSGTLEIKSTGVTATKTPVINVLGFAEQTGGVIEMDLDVATTNQIYGIYIANKDQKDPVTGKNLGLVYGLFDGGLFNATVGGWKSAAVYGNKGSVDITFKGGETIEAELTGAEARFANVAGNLVFKRCLANVTMPEAYSSITNARVFKSDKSISVSDGHYVVNTPGSGTEVFSGGNAITIDGGTFELTTDDDCFSALNNITVNDGLFYAVSTANDVFDSNGDMDINGGTILAYATAEGHEAFDVEPELTAEGTTPHQLRINGGVIFATGGKGADWPNDLVPAAGLNVYAEEDLTASDYSEKYISIESAAGVIYTAKLPAFPQTKCAVLVSCPNRTAADPTLSGTAPTSGSQDFHEYYINEKVDTNQQALRFFEIYGSTKTNATETTGDVGEYIVLTNVSAKPVALAGVVVSSAKYDVKKGKIDTPKCLITLGEKTLPAGGSIMLKQSDYATNGWQKITNGNIFIKLVDATGAEIQSGYTSFDNAKYPGVDMLGNALRAIQFVRAMEDTTDYWTSVPHSEDEPVPAPIIGGGEGSPITISATSVSIKISNAVAGHRYGYKKSVTLAGLATAATILLEPVKATGEYVLEIPRAVSEECCFYKIVVE